MQQKKKTWCTHAWLSAARPCTLQPSAGRRSAPPWPRRLPPRGPCRRVQDLCEEDVPRLGPGPGRLWQAPCYLLLATSGVARGRLTRGRAIAGNQLRPSRGQPCIYRAGLSFFRFLQFSMHVIRSRSAQAPFTHSFPPACPCALPRCALLRTAAVRFQRGT